MERRITRQSLCSENTLVFLYIFSSHAYYVQKYHFHSFKMDPIWRQTHFTTMYSKVWLCAHLCFLCSKVVVWLKIMKPAVKFRRKCYANEEHQRQQVYSHRNFTNEIYSLLKTGSTGYNITELRQGPSWLSSQPSPTCGVQGRYFHVIVSGPFAKTARGQGSSNL